MDLTTYSTHAQYCVQFGAARGQARERHSAVTVLLARLGTCSLVPTGVTDDN